MTWLSDCYSKPPPRSLKVGSEVIGIAGISEIVGVALENFDAPDEDVKQVLLTELKKRNYVPSSEEKAYLKSLWKEFEKVREVHRESVEETHQGIPRNEIPWFPKIDVSRCEGCSSCVEFCSQNVFAFFEGKSQVVRPQNCIVGKSSCRDFCPDNAISFPTRSQLKETLSELKCKLSQG